MRPDTRPLVEVRAAATVRQEVFAGLRRLEPRRGDDLLVGLVLYTGLETLPFGPKPRAMPDSTLWAVNGDQR